MSESVHELDRSLAAVAFDVAKAAGCTCSPAVRTNQTGNVLVDHHRLCALRLLLETGWTGQ